MSRIDTDTHLHVTGMHAVHEHITSFTAPLPDIPTDGAGGGKLATIYDNEEDTFIRGEWNWNGISPVEGVRQTQYATPMVQLLRDAGYYTVHVGKAHWAASGTPVRHRTTWDFSSKSEVRRSDIRNHTKAKTTTATNRACGHTRQCRIWCSTTTPALT